MPATNDGSVQSWQLLCDADWTATAYGWTCSGNVTQAVFSATVEYTPEMIVEGLFYGFSVAFPLMMVAWGGRQVLKLVR